MVMKWLWNKWLSIWDWFFETEKRLHWKIIDKSLLFLIKYWWVWLIGFIALFIYSESTKDPETVELPFIQAVMMSVIPVILGFITYVGVSATIKAIKYKDIYLDEEEDKAVNEKLEFGALLIALLVTSVFALYVARDYF